VFRHPGVRTCVLAAPVRELQSTPLESSWNGQSPPCDARGSASWRCCARWSGSNNAYRPGGPRSNADRGLAAKERDPDSSISGPTSAWPRGPRPIRQPRGSALELSPAAPILMTAISSLFGLPLPAWCCDLAGRVSPSSPWRFRSGNRVVVRVGLNECHRWLSSFVVPTVFYASGSVKSSWGSVRQGGTPGHLPGRGLALP